MKIAAEWLLDTGRAVCVRRDRLAARLRPARARRSAGHCSTTEPTDAECLAYLVGTTARALGVATHADLIEYQRLNGHGLHIRGGEALDEAAEAAGLTPVTVARRQEAGRAPGPTRPRWRGCRPAGAAPTARRCSPRSTR